MRVESYLRTDGRMKSLFFGAPKNGAQETAHRFLPLIKLYQESIWLKVCAAKRLYDSERGSFD
jgi:hypothetical protein